jgi:DnaJ family protein B protein 12
MRTGAMPRRQAGNQADQNRNQLLQLLPVIIIFLLPVLSSLLSSLFGSTPIPDPAYSFQKNSQYSITRLTTPHKVPYYVNPASWQAHPIYETIPVNVRGEKQAGPKANSRQLNAFETRIEDRFAASYYSECQREHQKKERDLENARGFFGIGADLARLKEVQARKLESCEVLKRHGFIS